MAGVYSKAYQTVTAGRVREDEAIAFYGQNRVSCGRDTAIVNLSAQQQPVLAVDVLQHTGVGKPGQVAKFPSVANPLGMVSDNISAYNGASYQNS